MLRLMVVKMVMAGIMFRIQGLLFGWEDCIYFTIDFTIICFVHHLYLGASVMRCRIRETH